MYLHIVTQLFQEFMGGEESTCFRRRPIYLEFLQKSFEPLDVESIGTRNGPPGLLDLRLFDLSHDGQYPIVRNLIWNGIAVLEPKEGWDDLNKKLSAYQRRATGCVNVRGMKKVQE